MNMQILLGGLAAVLALGSLGFLAYFMLAPRQDSSIRQMMRGRTDHGGIATGYPGGGLAEDGFEKAKKVKKKKKTALTLEERLFQAGIFDQQDRAEFDRLRLLSPLIGLPAGALIGGYFAVQFALVGAIMGLLLGLQLPFSILDRKLQARQDDVLFFLPLVIEQLAIGVSSSLDIGPCIMNVINMADERDSHNSVTELLALSQHQVKSGVPLDDALNEIGIRSGSTELKHAFMSLAQVSRHGGEITRQLQELADSIGRQRETKIEGKIKKLELEATGPVAMVFMGFLVILLIGFGIQIRDAFG